MNICFQKNFENTNQSNTTCKLYRPNNVCINHHFVVLQHSRAKQFKAIYMAYKLLSFVSAIKFVRLLTIGSVSSFVGCFGATFFFQDDELFRRLYLGNNMGADSISLYFEYHNGEAFSGCFYSKTYF